MKIMRQIFHRHFFLPKIFIYFHLAFRNMFSKYPFIYVSINLLLLRHLGQTTSQ